MVGDNSVACTMPRSIGRGHGFKSFSHKATQTWSWHLLGIKADLVDAKNVATEVAHTYAQENGLFFMETSAKAATNVNDIFYAIAKRLPRLQPAQKPSGMVLTDRPAGTTSSASCCS